LIVFNVTSELLEECFKNVGRSYTSHSTPFVIRVRLRF